MIEEIESFGIGLKQPSPYEISTRVIKTEVEDIHKIKVTHMAAWKQYEYTVMPDGWTDRKSRSLINFLVNSPEGLLFISPLMRQNRSRPELSCGSNLIRWWRRLASSMFFK